MTLGTPLAPQEPSPVLVTLGRIAANEHWVTTPVGSWKLKDISVTPYDQTVLVSRIPVWAIVMAIVTAVFFLLGLLFLLAKENQVAGYVSVIISTTDGQSYTEQLPINSAPIHHDVLSRIHYLQSLIGQARVRA